ncbi:MAG: AtpZ/AtpI family protein [Alphaproteobacteria bacterium]|nr:AtpZ/AtpI family protein [Alphaproteobacteria bacterium]
MPTPDPRLEKLAESIAAEEAERVADTQKNVRQPLPPSAKLGFEIVGAMLGCGAVGWWIDSELSVAPWGLLGGLLLGLIAGIYGAWRMMNRLS